MRKLPLVLIFFSILSSASVALGADQSKNESFNMGSTINSSYRRLMSQYFLEIQKLSKSQKNMESFIFKAFYFRKPPTASEKTELKKLANLAIPKVMLISDGIEFEFENSTRFAVTLSKDLGQINVGEVRKHANNLKSSDKKNFAFAMSDLQLLPQAHGNLLGRGAIWVFRLLVGKSAKVTASTAAVGGAVGCTIGMKHNKGETTPAEDCADGALTGAFSAGLVSVIPDADNFAIALINGTIKLNPLVSRSFQLAGILGTLVLSQKTIAAIQEMDGTILRCQGIEKGDFIFSAKAGGITRQTLYEVHKGQLLLSVGDKNISLPLNSDSLAEFLKTKPEFKDSSAATLKNQAEVLLSEILPQVEICKKHGHGHTQSNSETNATVKIIKPINIPTETK